MIRVLQFLGLLPGTLLVWLGYILPAWKLRWIRFDDRPAPFVWSFVLRSRAPDFYHRYWEDWMGWSGPCVIITKQDPSDSDRYARTLQHELEHCRQQFRFGIVFYPLYALMFGIIYVMYPDLHPYYDNPFEVGARKAAGQRVKITRDDWTLWRGQRNPWW